ncbi:MAG TPA: S24 family peptidase [Bacillota bacterium]|nr:S24 family peptidase [Bacillota bacterium]
MTFDKKKFAMLLAQAKGNRSINRYGNLAKVDPGYISRLLREKIETPPGPGVIKKLAGVACQGVTYEDMMVAAGHLQEPGGAGLYSSGNNFEKKVAEALQKPLAEFFPVKNIPLVNPLPYSAGEADIGSIVGHINVPREIEADFALMVKDHAMIEAGIFPGDVAVCRKSGDKAPDGSMVVTRVNGGNVSIRYLISESGSYRLKAANCFVPAQAVDRPEVIGVVLMIQKKALKYDQYEKLRERDRNEEITEDFLMEKLSENTGIPLSKLKEALALLKKKR